jgi:hypothetical protein
VSLLPPPSSSSFCSLPFFLSSLSSLPLWTPSLSSLLRAHSSYPLFTVQFFTAPLYVSSHSYSSRSLFVFLFSHSSPPPLHRSSSRLFFTTSMHSAFFTPPCSLPASLCPFHSFTPPLHFPF